MNNQTENKVLSDEFIKALLQWSAGYISPETFDRFINILDTEARLRYFSRSAESNLLRIIKSSYDKSVLITDTTKYPHYAEILILVSVNSNYLSDILVRNPEYFFWIVNPANLNADISYEYYLTSLKNLINSYKTFAVKVNALRIFKRKELLRIGLQDLSGLAGVKKVTEKLSHLAKAVSSVLMDLCYNQVLEKYGIKEVKRKYCLAALGKLGGGELNYSSDIDLILFFDKNSKIKNKQYDEIIVEAAFLFIESASAVTNSGFLYRVDFRLRPYGRNSPLAMSISSYLSYYETRGEDWERQMLIKASFISGSRSLFDKFYGYLSHFIYPSSFIVSPLEQIRKMKTNIERQLKGEFNIKLIPGGIRDIEFGVQALQLINGGKIKTLQTGNTLEAINKLHREGLLKTGEKESLSSAYIFYRRVEHYLQLMNDAQTHTIPQSGEMLNKLSGYLGFSSESEFKAFISECREKVLSIYSSIMGSTTDVAEASDGWDRIHFKDSNKARRDIDYLRSGKGIFEQKTFDKRTSEYFAKIEESIIKYLISSSNPDIILQNLVKIIRPSRLPSIWYSQLQDKKLFKSVMLLCGESQRSIDLLSTDKELRDYFLSKKIFERINSGQYADVALRKLISILSVQLALGLINNKTVSLHLDRYVRFQIARSAADFINDTGTGVRFFIGGLGSFGTGSLSFGSDIDLIFAAERIEGGAEFPAAFMDLLNDIKHKLHPLKVDIRLRPEGTGGRVITDLKGYQTYFNSRARIWEYQAFTKLSFVSGDRTIYRKLLNIIKKGITSNINRSRIKSEMIEMRKKLVPQVLASAPGSFHLKKSRGGMLDIEFVMQYLILCNPKLISSCAGLGIDKAAKRIVKEYPNMQELRLLSSNYDLLKEIEILNQNRNNSDTQLISFEDNEFLRLFNKAGYDDKDGFLKDLRNRISFNISSFEKYIMQADCGKD